VKFPLQVEMHAWVFCFPGLTTTYQAKLSWGSPSRHLKKLSYFIGTNDTFVNEREETSGPLLNAEASG